ncbi:MAG: PhzF family phenazine biosynthesis protein [Proteobacteria bacterium]|nr:PhzF family phenazine biosynthesis protein [Pseudomonadota bacterium]
MLEFIHVDVFASGAYSGNPLPVFLVAQSLAPGQMQAITREFRQFEAVFLERTDDSSTVRARVFDLIEELPFAGHPLLGAAAALHTEMDQSAQREWNLIVGNRRVAIRTRRTGSGLEALMDQGRPTFGATVADRNRVAQAFSLLPSDLTPHLPLQVVSTGLQYLVVPVRAEALTRAHIVADISSMLADFGAQFAVLLDEDNVEVRHWNNDGLLEDVATGSAAGTIGAYRLKHGLVAADQEFTIQQGRFAGRPSQLRVVAYGSPGSIESVSVGGSVVVLGRGRLERLP